MGTVVVAFVVNRSGGVVSSRLVRSSGDPVMDAKAVSTPRSASPVPAPPPDVEEAPSRSPFSSDTTRETGRCHKVNRSISGFPGGNAHETACAAWSLSKHPQL
ncbi:energy transducer TonB [Bradyrhizobium sp. RDT10]